MTSYDDGSILAEHVSLFERHPTDPVWTHRLNADDPVLGLGETFLFNSQVTPTATAAAALVPQAALDMVGAWLRDMVVHEADGLFRDTQEPAPFAPVVTLSALSSFVGFDLGALPPMYQDWRLTTEVYVLTGASLYAVVSDLAIRHRVLSEEECGIAYGQRLLPFLTVEPDQFTGAMVFLVSVPSRAAAMGGLRGYRRGLLQAGVALTRMQQLAEKGGDNWLWETEFYDDACCRVLGVDGIERVPVAVGVQFASDGSGGNDAEPAEPQRPGGVG